MHLAALQFSSLPETVANAKLGYLNANIGAECLSRKRHLQPTLEPDDDISDALF